MQKSIQLLLCALLAQGSPTDWSSPNQIQRRASNFNQAPAYNSAAQRPSYGKPFVSTARGLKKSSSSINGIPKPPSSSLGKQDFTYETSDDDSDVDSDEDKPDVKSSMQNKPSAGSQTAAKCSAPASKPTPRNTYAGNKNANMADQSRSEAEPSEESSDDEDGKNEQSRNNPKAGGRQRKVAFSDESSDEKDADVSDDVSDSGSEDEDEKKKPSRNKQKPRRRQAKETSDEESSDDDEKTEQARVMPSAGKQLGVAGESNGQNSGYNAKPSSPSKGARKPKYGQPISTRDHDASFGRPDLTDRNKAKKATAIHLIKFSLGANTTQF
ncbi:hypothetical protein DSO57_1031981 [Entomophthora muscae]|uniref:Uncharacterized protein n=2 Tax=Entomophthora muscae TaxID=34485 RepID=A0ACC2UAG9_9FUNG|nr:hypothetical protein DSO57_1031980 [Entomophthora muscae]KAJ9083716.1 hypothetical protein DSO57_1031981 [Entomophthora muscae]